MKRILIFGLTNTLGGVEAFVLNFYKKMDRDLCQFDFLVYQDIPSYRKIIEELGGRVFIVPGRRKNPVGHFFAMQKFFRQRADEYSAIWCNQCTLSDVSPLAAAKRFGIKKRIIHAHNSQNMSGVLAGVLHKINQKRISSLATDYWACSKLAGSFFYLTSLLEQSQFCVIPNAVDIEQFRFQPAARDSLRLKYGVMDSFVIINVGRLHFQKNQTFLLDIFQKLLQRKPNAQLWLIGTGEELPALEEKVRQLQIEAHTTFWGNRRDVPDLLQAADVFVSTSLFEGNPIVLIEAQAAGLPCIASDSISEEVELTKQIKRISLEFDAEYWAEKIIEIYTNTPRQDLSDQVRENGFDVNRQVIRLMELLL